MERPLHQLRLTHRKPAERARLLTATQTSACAGLEVYTNAIKVDRRGMRGMRGCISAHGSTHRISITSTVVVTRRWLGPGRTAAADAFWPKISPAQARPNALRARSSQSARTIGKRVLSATVVNYQACMRDFLESHKCTRLSCVYPSHARNPC